MEKSLLTSKLQDNTRFSSFVVRISLGEMSSFGTGFRNRRGVLVGVGFLISVAFYTASWVPWNVHSEHYGGRYRDVDLNTGSDMSFQSSSSSGRDFDWESVSDVLSGIVCIF